MSYLSEVQADTPWGTYVLEDMSGDLQDSSGNNRHLTAYGPPVYREPGPGSGSYSILFPDSGGATEYYAASIGHEARTATVTYEAIIRIDEIPSVNTPVAQITQGYNIANGEKLLWVDVLGRLQWSTYISSWEHIIASSPLEVGRWHHVVCSVGPAGTKIRIDKVTVATGVRTTSENVRANVLLLHGGTSGSPSNMTNGKPLRIARFSMWQSQISDARTDAHFDAWAAEFGIGDVSNLSKIEYHQGAQVSWKPGEFATQGEYRVDGGSPVTVTGNSANITGLTNGQTYIIEVRSKNGSTVGAWQSIQITPESGVIYDDFERANVAPGANVLGNATSGHTWNPGSGVLGITGGKVYTNVSGDNRAYFTMPDADHTVEASLDIYDPQIEIRGRGATESWLYNGRYLYRRLNNAYTIVWDRGSQAPNGSVIKLGAKGKQIKIWTNGVLEHVREDWMYLPTDTRAYLRMPNATPRSSWVRMYPSKAEDFPVSEEAKSHQTLVTEFGNLSQDAWLYKGRNTKAQDTGAHP